MKKISKAEFIRLIVNNHSGFLGAGLKQNTIEWYFEKAKECEPIGNRTARVKGQRLVFSNDSILDLSCHVNNEFTVSEFYQDGNHILSYLMNKKGNGASFDTESIIMYYIYK